MFGDDHIEPEVLIGVGERFQWRYPMETTEQSL